MQQLDLTLALVVVATSFGTAVLALTILFYLRPPRRIVWTPADRMGEPIVFLFRDQELVDATSDARALLESGPDFLDDWPRALAVLEARFPDFTEEIGRIPDSQHFNLGNESGDEIEAEWRGGLIRVVVRETSTAASNAPDRFSQAALTEELATLRSVVDCAPMLVWREDSSGAVRWANGAYVALAEQMTAEDEPVAWPLPRIFGQRLFGQDTAAPPRRLSVKLPGQAEESWFDCYEERQAEDTLVFATPADKLVRAEGSLREFVQTLTKTFAHLPTGLAIFDKERRLALFNPALTDLSSLEPQFLSARPTLFEFLDRLRQKQRAPEPKNFSSWRKQILELETMAASGTYQETWSLPTGQTYRVTGRPHPDGAIAFLFEDISSEISLTRNFRAELDLCKAMLDSVDEGIAVFGSSGTMVASNAAYARLWDHDPDASLGDTGIIEATRLWQDACAPSPAWGELRDFAGDPGERAEWWTEVQRSDGQTLTCRVVPLPGHTTLVGFAPVGTAGHAQCATAATTGPIPTTIR